MTKSFAEIRIDEGKAVKGAGPSSISWGHLSGMLVLMTGTVSFWLLVFGYAKRRNGKRG